MRTLWLIAARSQSKSIPHKNVRSLAGHPLLAYRAGAALFFASPEDVWISTDSQKYADLAASYGVHVPFLRPAELASDTAKSADVVLHAMAHAVAIGRSYDAVGLLEPTSPFVLPAHLQAAEGRLWASPEAEAIVATRPVRPSTFFVQKASEYLTEIAERIAGHGALRRQDEVQEITPSGGFYIARWSSFSANRSFYTPRTLSFVVSEMEGLEIDEPIDWDWAEFLLASGRLSPSAFGL